MRFSKARVSSFHYQDSSRCINSHNDHIRLRVLDSDQAGIRYDSIGHTRLSEADQCS